MMEHQQQLLLCSDQQEETKQSETDEWRTDEWRTKRSNAEKDKERSVVERDDIETVDEESDDTDVKKWIIVQDRFDHKQYTSLLQEVEYLKGMVVEMHKLMMIQGENVERIGSNVDSMNASVIFVSREISLMKNSKVTQSKLAYLRDYLVPTLRLAGTYTPILMLMASKAGFTMSTLSYLFFKLF